MKADAHGFTAHKFGPPRTTPENDIAHDRSNRLLTTRELTNIRRAYENCQLAAIYNDNYFFGTSPVDSDQYANDFARLKAATASAYLDRIERYLGWNVEARQGRRLLDVGSGLGDLLLVAQQRGYEVTGVEYSPSSVARARDSWLSPAASSNQYQMPSCSSSRCTNFASVYHYCTQ